MPSHSPPPGNPSPGAQRLVFIDALRAFGSIAILLHHFALYPPLGKLAAPLLGASLDWLEQNARTTQIFFGVSGYVMARSLSRGVWNPRQIGLFLMQRYCRLGIPYLAAVVLVLIAYAFAAGHLPAQIVGGPVTSEQLLAHLFLVQDLLGQEQLSAGFWFVCINFQLGLVYVLMLGLRDAVGRRLDAAALVGWALAIYSLFDYNLRPGGDAWALYFFPYFFIGVVVHRSLQPGGRRSEFWHYLAICVCALAFSWRWRLLIGVLVGVLLYVAQGTGWGQRWPKSRVVAWLGQISYSLFLVHFPVLVLVSTACLRCGWTSPPAALAGLIAAIALSLASASALHRWVEKPAGRLARRLSAQRPMPPLAATAAA